MPSITIEVNGIRVATIDLAGMELVDVSVHGALDRSPKAALDAYGGNYAPGGSGHLIWIAERPLLPGEVVRVKLTDECGIADQGKTIAELYPDAEPATRSDFSISDAMADEIRARPRLHDDFLVQAETSSGEKAIAASDGLHTNFAFSFLWHKDPQHQVRVRLASYCSANVLARTGGTTHLQTTLGLGASVAFVLVR